MTAARRLATLPELGALLDATRTIAVVGLSDKADRESHQIAAWLQARGYRIIGVNPSASSILDEPSYPSLSAIPEEERRRIDLVAVFRKPADAVEVAREAAGLGLLKVWFVPGSFSQAAEEAAVKLGLTYVPDICIRTARNMTLPR